MGFAADQTIGGPGSADRLIGNAVAIGAQRKRAVEDDEDAENLFGWSFRMGNMDTRRCVLLLAGNDSGRELFGEYH
ncbi:MAG: hypothetical protein PHP44_12520 [Kiritimatiellae bacterium]|nr:hypothetical protein [Kiritimatiellia bacterium]